MAGLRLLDYTGERVVRADLNGYVLTVLVPRPGLHRAHAHRRHDRAGCWRKRCEPSRLHPATHLPRNGQWFVNWGFWSFSMVTWDYVRRLNGQHIAKQLKGDIT